MQCLSGSGLILILVKTGLDPHNHRRLDPHSHRRLDPISCPGSCRLLLAFGVAEKQSSGNVDTSICWSAE